MTQKIAIFNETGSHVISMMDYDATFVTNLTANNVKHKVLTIDLASQYYWGDFATGSIRSRNDQPIVEEVVLDTIINKDILARYPIHTQLNIIADCIEKSGIPLTPEFQEMRSWIGQKVANHNSAIDAYASNPNVYSWWPKPTIPTEE